MPTITYDTEKEARERAIEAWNKRTERPKGRWRKYSSDEWICTHCGYDKYCDTLDGGVLPDFCEGCGADMRGERNA